MNNKSSYNDDIIPIKEKESLLKRSKINMDEFRSLLLDKVKTPQGEFLDLACGHGVRSTQMAELFPEGQHTGLDLNQEFVDYAREIADELRLTNISFKQFDIFKDQLKPNKYDFIYSRLFFQHIKEIDKVLSFVLNSLKPDGLLVIEDTTRSSMQIKSDEFCLEFNQLIEDFKKGQKEQGGSPDIGIELYKILDLKDSVNFMAQKETFHFQLGTGLGSATTIELLETLSKCYLNDQRQEEAKVLLKKLSQKRVSGTFSWYVFYLSKVKK